MGIRSRTLITAFLLLLLGAWHGLAGREGENQDLARKPLPLSPEDKAELIEALRLQKTLGAQVWPGFDRAEIPIILYDETSEFLIGLQNPPAPWMAVEGDDFQGRPYFRRSASKPQSFAVRTDGRWAGSLSTLSLMNRRAPLKLRQDFHIVLLLHEMFHAFQAEQAPERFDRALKVYAVENRYFFGDPEFAAAWDKEGALLAAGLKAPDEAAARRAAREFLDARESRRRKASLGPDLLAFERELEWLEGLAKYAESRFSELAASPSGGPPPSTPILSDPFRQWDFVRLEKQLGRQKGDLRFYLSGSAQALLLDRLSADWKAKMRLADIVLEDALRHAVGPPDRPAVAEKNHVDHRLLWTLTGCSQKFFIAIRMRAGFVLLGRPV
ncbi:MAG: hypothetical protein AB1715_01205 [Acidobacteriota bacterium]